MTDLVHRAKQVLLGKARDFRDPGLFDRLSLIAFFAWVGLGADGLSSSCYGPEEAFLTLHGHPHLGIFVALGTVVTIIVISTSYSQIVEAFPSGGGGYYVASKLLNPTLGMISGCALLIDYVLTITLSISSGADAIFSFMPETVYAFKLPFAILGLIILIIMNLRGVKESVIPLVPIFMLFIVLHAIVVIFALVEVVPSLSSVANATSAEVHRSQMQLGTLGMILLILRSYSMGAGTYTGIEAVSNAVPMLRDPKVETAKRTMRYMSISLAVMVLGLMLGYIVFQVRHVPGKTLNASLLHEITHGWNGELGYGFVLVTLISEAVLLFVASQTGFLGGPRVLANMALDRWVPSRFSVLSDRLVSHNGILIMGCLSLILMILTRGSVRFLVVLYSITVFITFLLSQLGMVRHWWKSRHAVKSWFSKLAVNGVGLVLTAFILISVSIIKFHDGGWITLLVTGLLVLMSLMVKRHYNQTNVLLRRLDILVESAQTSISLPPSKDKLKMGSPDPTARTAIILVNGFNGLGLHTLFGIIRLFGKDMRNFVFVQVGIIDASVFKGTEEMNLLEQRVNDDLSQYVQYMNREGCYAEGVSAMGTDVVEAMMDVAPRLLERFPQAIFFGGQIVFPKEPLFSRWLHNYTVFAIQRRFYYEGIPLVLMPIKIQ